MSIHFDFTATKNCFNAFEKTKSNPVLAPKIPLKPQITIAIPTFNRAKLLKEAIDSALNQKYDDAYEILVVDNNPDRGCETENLIAKYKSSQIRYYKNEQNIGMFGNWNRCIELALGEYITILNDDDLLDKRFLFYVMKAALKTNKLILTGAYKISCYPFILPKKQNKIKALLKQNIEINNYIVGNQSYGTLGLMYKKRNMLDLGGFDKDFFPSSDYVFNSKYVAKYGGIKLIKKLAYYRILENESIKESNLKAWPVIDSQIKKEICKHTLPNAMKENLLLYALINQKIYLENQWKAKITFTKEEQRFMKMNYILYGIKRKLMVLRQIIKGTFYGTS